MLAGNRHVGSVCAHVVGLGYGEPRTVAEHGALALRLVAFAIKANQTRNACGFVPGPLIALVA